MYSSSTQITPTTSAYTAASATTSSTTSSNSASGNMNEFMLMLMAQLKNQNPLEPMKDDQMLGQLAQLNSLNQLTDLNSKMEELIAASQIGYASSLVGKSVIAQVGQQDPIEGKVTAVTNEGGSWTATIGDQTVPLSAIKTVKEETSV